MRLLYNFDKRRGLLGRRGYLLPRGRTNYLLPSKQLYHNVSDAPSWDWNGHYSAEATLTGFAYNYANSWLDVAHTQTIDAPITYTDAEAPDEYASPERTYTATAVTPGVTFYDSKTEELSPRYCNIEGGKIYCIDDRFRLQNPVTINTLQNGGHGYFKDEILTVHYDRDEAKLTLIKEGNEEHPDDVAEIQIDENKNYTFTGYFFVEENPAVGQLKLIPIYHGNFGGQRGRDGGSSRGGAGGGNPCRCKGGGRKVKIMSAKAIKKLEGIKKMC